MVTKSETAVPKLGARNTRQRTAVVSVLRDMDYFASAKKSTKNSPDATTKSA